MSPRLTRLGAHGSRQNGGRYWLALFDASGAQTNPTCGAVSEGRIFVGADFYPTSGADDRMNWAVFTKSGDLLTERKADSASDSYVRCCAADGAGNVYVSGLVFSTPYVHALVKLDGNGQTVWQAGEDDSYRASFAHMAASGSYVYGITGNTLVRLSATDGSLLWKVAVSSTLDVACDSSGNVYVLRWNGFPEAQLWKIDSTGAFVWGVTLSHATAITQFGSVCVKGSYVYVNTGWDSTWSHVAKFDLSGTLQWATVLDYIDTSNIAVDDAGNVFAGGATFVQLNTSGTLQWSRTITNGPAAIVCDADALVLVSDVTGGVVPLDFGVVMRVPLDGSGTGSWSFAFLSDTASWDYSAASVATYAESLTVGTTSASLTLNYDTSPATPDGSTFAGQVRSIVTV